MNPYDTAVADGAAILDEYKPGWLDKINTSILDITDVDRCILGQVYGDDAGDSASGYGYAFGWWPCVNPDPLPESAEKMCFYTGDPEMRDAWIDLIDKRREEVTA